MKLIKCHLNFNHTFQSRTNRLAVGSDGVTCLNSLFPRNIMYESLMVIDKAIQSNLWLIQLDKQRQFIFHR